MKRSSSLTDRSHAVVLAHNIDRVTIDISDMSIDDDYGPQTPTPRTRSKVKRAKASWKVKAKARHLQPSTTPKMTPPRHLLLASTTPKTTPPRHLRPRPTPIASTTPKTMPPVLPVVAFIPAAPAYLNAASSPVSSITSRKAHRTRMERATKAVSGVEMALRARINRSWRKMRMEIDL